MISAWLIMYSSGAQEIIEAEDLYEIYNKTIGEVDVVIRLREDLRIEE